MAVEINSFTSPLSVALGGFGLTTIPALSIPVANSSNIYTTVTPAAGQSIRINAGGTAWEAFTPSAGGTVNSVGLTVNSTSPSGIFTVSGSPVTTSGTLNIAIAGTSGGVPYFSSSTVISSSALLATNQIVLGGGAATAPATLGSLGTTTTVLHGNAAGAPTFGAVSLTADVSGILPGANGGTGNGFFAISGPTTSLKTFAFPDASATVLTTNAAVTVPQGGTGNTTFTAFSVICAGTTATGAFQNVSGLGTAGFVLTSTGAGALPTWQAPATSGTVTSISFTGGIISVANPTTTPALTVAGTSGGIPYFSSTTTWASSALLAANSPILGGGAGTAPATVAGITSDGVSVLTLGVAGSSVGSIGFRNATSGTITLAPPTGALGTVTQTLQAVTGTIYSTGGTDVAVADGGTALSSIAALSLLVANSANVFVALTAGASQSIRVNAGATAWEAFTPAAGTVTSVSGTTNRITSTGGATPVIDISASYIGQTSITTLGTVTTGTLSTGAVIGGVTMTLGTDATGDTYYRNSGGVLTRLGIGATGNVLTVAGGLPSWAAPATSGTVTSVSFTGGIISVATATTTPALTVAGTSGGIVYFSSASTWASSAALAANAIVIGGGAGVAPATTTTGTGILTFLGTPSSANLAAALTDETGTGVAVFGTSPAITTSLTTPSTSFDLLNTTATTINFAGAATTLNIGASATCILNFGGSTTASEFRFLEPSGSGTNYSAFKAVAQAANITYSLPPTVGAAGTVLTDAAGNGVLTWAAGGGSSGITIGTTTITSGTTTRILYDNAGVLGEYTITGTGTVVAMQTSPAFTTPSLGAATATSINGLIITTTAGTLTIANNASASLITSGNFALTLTATATTNSTLPAGTHTLGGLDVAQTWSATQTYTKAIICTPTVLTDAATIATDAATGRNFRVTLGGNRTLGAPTNGVDGEICVWEIIQDGTGNRTLALAVGAGGFAYGTEITAVTISAAANTHSFITAFYNSTNNRWYVTGAITGYNTS